MRKWEALLASLPEAGQDHLRATPDDGDAAAAAADPSGASARVRLACPVLNIPHLFGSKGTSRHRAGLWTATFRRLAAACA